MTSPSLPPRLTGPSRFLTPGWENLTTSVWTLGKKSAMVEEKHLSDVLEINFQFRTWTMSRKKRTKCCTTDGQMVQEQFWQWKLLPIYSEWLEFFFYKWTSIYPQPWKPPDSFPWIVATTHFRCATRGRCRFASSTPAMIEIKWWVGYIKSLLVFKYIPCRELMYSFTNALFEDGFPFPNVGIS